MPPDGVSSRKTLRRLKAIALFDRIPARGHAANEVKGRIHRRTLPIVVGMLGHPTAEAVQAYGMGMVNAGGREPVVHEQGRRDLLHSLVAELGMLHVPSDSYSPQGALDLVAWSIRRRPRPEIVYDAVVVGAAVAQPLDALQHIEVVPHTPVIEPVGAELVEVDEASERNDLDELPCREAVAWPPLDETTRVGTRLALGISS